MLDTIITRGTTPDIDIELPFNTAALEAAYISFAQVSHVVIERAIKDMTLDGTHLNFRLSQQETLRLSDKFKVRIQGRFKLDDGTLLASDIYEASVGRIEKEGEI